MQISAASGGPYPALLPRARKPGGEGVEAASGASAAGAARARQQMPAASATSPAEVSRALLLARQRSGFAGAVNNGPAAQRAVAAYTAVAAQAQRSALIEVLVGIDVFA